VRFEDELDGDASAIGGLFTGMADLAVLDREASFIEVDAYQQGTGYDPFRIPLHAARWPSRIMRRRWLSTSTAQILSAISVCSKLDGIFDADHRLGKQRYKTWGDLGLTGDGLPGQSRFTHTIYKAPRCSFLSALR